MTAVLMQRSSIDVHRWRWRNAAGMVPLDYWRTAQPGV